MSIYRTSVHTVLYVGVPKSLFRFLQFFFQCYDENIDKDLDSFLEAAEETKDDTFDEILENAGNLGIDSIVVYELD